MHPAAIERVDIGATALPNQNDRRRHNAAATAPFLSAVSAAARLNETHRIASRHTNIVCNFSVFVSS
jgi:hypothetical protein